MTSLYISLRESIEFSFILFLLTGIYKEHRKILIISAALAVFAGILTTWINFPVSGLLKKTYTGYMFFGFIMVLLMSFVSDKKAVYPVSALALMLYLPAAQLSAVIFDEAYLKGSYILIYAFGGMATGAVIFLFSLRFRHLIRPEKYFGYDGIMVFLSSFCFMFGGLNEFDHLSVVTSLQQGFHVFLSSFIPFMRKVLLIPDGRTITTSFNAVFDYLSSQRVAMALTATVLFAPPLFVFVRLLLMPEPETFDAEKKAVRRKILAVYISELLKKGTPLIISLIASIVMLHAANLSLMPAYEPEPIPVIADNDLITIPLKDKTGDISDGKLRKYSFQHKEEIFRFFMIMKPDGEITAVLDACEICPPRGYVQRGEHVICKYCNTPIPLQSLGQPGGCNPIPVKYKVEGDIVTLSRADIIDAYKKEAGKESGAVLR